MKSYKELWNEEHERIYETLVVAGCPEETARELADEHAGEKALERYVAEAESFICNMMLENLSGQLEVVPEQPATKSELAAAVEFLDERLP